MFPGSSFAVCFLLLVCLFSPVESTRAHHSTNRSLIASTPPRGWNSYDSYSWIISEREFLRNAELVAEKLLPFGYEFVVVDFLWYRRNTSGVSITTPGFDHIDKWGRPVPDPERWPSSAGGRGLKPVADRVHAMGLKFGIHVMRGISTVAVRKNTPILGREGSFIYRSENHIWRARDIALQNQPCSWMAQCFVSVNESSEGGQAFIQSLYDLYASWEVDFVKHDCVFGVDDLSVKEITAVSEAILATRRPMLYSISPGVQADPSMASFINGLVNMFRITGDDWDSWSDLNSHFNVARDFAAAGLVGGTGLLGFSWPDLDMLPMGYLTDPGANHGPYRFSRLTLDEQRTQMTLWAMAKSPLMFGGDMINLDHTTLGLLTDPTILEINANSFGNMEVTNAMHSVIPLVHLHECQDARETMWSLRYGTTSGSIDQLCWLAVNEGEHKGDVVREGCLPWESSTAVSIENLTMTTISTTTQVKKFNGEGFHTCATQMRVAEQYSIGTVVDTMNVSGRVHICDSFAEKLCLDAGAIGSGRFNSSRRIHFSVCSQNENQVWHLNSDGKLVNNGSKLCAVVTPIQPKVSSVVGQGTDTRIWMARGPEGEYYIAFFNLGGTTTNISVPLASIIGAGFPNLPARRELDGAIPGPSYECTGQEVWSDYDIGTIRGTLLTAVASHGCTLFSLQCSLI